MGFWDFLWNTPRSDSFPPLPTRDIFLGTLPDVRPPEEKEKDYNIREIVPPGAAAAPAFPKLNPGEVPEYGVQNQDGSSSCVAQTRRKLYRVLYKNNLGLDVDFSAKHLYRRRANYPAGGMSAPDVISLCRNGGMTLEPLMPSDNQSESQMNAAKIEPYMDEVAKVFTVPNEVTFTPGDFDMVASTMTKTKKAIMLWFYFTQEEWSREVPVVLDKYLDKPEHPRALRHSVAGIIPANYVSKDGIYIDDSAHFGGLSRRFITKDFFKARNYWASYPITFKFLPDTVQKPKHEFNTDFYNLGVTHPDIKALQDVLKYEGLFPTNVESTGYFGSITRSAVAKFQIRYGISPAQGNVGPLTRAKLNELYS